MNGPKDRTRDEAIALKRSQCERFGKSLARFICRRRAAQMASHLAASAAVLDEFMAADIVVIGAHPYNFTIPS